jgi:hypothetical protein
MLVPFCDGFFQCAGRPIQYSTGMPELFGVEHAYRLLEKPLAVNSTGERDGGHSSTADSKQ